MAGTAAEQPRLGFAGLLGATSARAGIGFVLVAFILLTAATVLRIPPLALLVPVAAVLVARPLASLHRRWAGWILGMPIPRPYLPATERGWRTRIATPARDPATWRDLAWLGVGGTAGLALCAVVVLPLGIGLGALLLAAAWLRLPTLANGYGSPLIYVDLAAAALGASPSAVLALGGLVLLGLWRLTGPPLLHADARLARWLLAPTEQSRLAIRVRELAESRAQAVDAQAAELRRIERDLHDGAQARLVALGMSLGLAEELIDRDPAAARELLAEARATGGQALSELRDVVRGVHPPVLADRGLDGAVRAFALGLPVPAHVEVDVAGRLSPAVESAAYFVVAEALTNVVKHAAAKAVRLRLRHTGGLLTISVTDDGVGGADPSCGTGLRGIQRRLAAFDGTLDVISPPGGPTLLTMELPCESSSPKTSPSSGTA